MIAGTLRPPRALAAAVGLWSALAAFLLVRTALAWTERPGLERRMVESGAVDAAGAATATREALLLDTGIAVVFAAGYLLAGALLRGRRPWARVGVCALFAVQLVLVLGSRTFSAANLVVLGLGAAAVWCSWTRSSTEWVTGEHE
ncbi:hypothetical protein ACL03H_19555 [Saccharopolyspora sp. MS10]|uniref:hypothetical protein n=1 Tax=Saccharopolyspora sp. MS10 TaxID=3385973 RepID=UPI0039A1D9C1